MYTYNVTILAVGGGAGGLEDYGGGGGEVVFANKGFDFECLDISIGSGGVGGGNKLSTDGGYTTVSYNNSQIVVAKPGRLSASGTNCGRGATCHGGGACDSATSVGGGKGFLGYGGGGGGGNGYDEWGCCGCDGGGNWQGGNATNYGGGGGGGNGGGCGCQGLVQICYIPGAASGINCATGGTKTTSGDYTVHTFTSNGTFTIVS